MATKAKAAEHTPWDDEHDEEWETVQGDFGEIENPEDGPVTGIYVGSRIVELDDDEAENGKRETRIHDFARPDTGDKFSVWGSTDLDSKLENVGSGTPTRITFLSKDSIKGGKRQFKRYRVQTRSA